MRKHTKSRLRPPPPPPPTKSNSRSDLIERIEQKKLTQGQLFNFVALFLSYIFFTLHFFDGAVHSDDTTPKTRNEQKFQTHLPPSSHRFQHSTHTHTVIWLLILMLAHINTHTLTLFNINVGCAERFCNHLEKLTFWTFLFDVVGLFAKANTGGYILCMHALSSFHFLCIFSVVCWFGHLKSFETQNRWLFFSRPLITPFM